MPRQLSLDFESLENRPTPNPQTEPRPQPSVAEVAESVRPKLLEILKQPTERSEIYDQLDFDPPPGKQEQSTDVVEHLLQELSDADRIVTYTEEGRMHYVLADATAKQTSLIRPDRQIVFEDDDPAYWPEPAYDDNSITVDRPRHDIDGPPHRFVIHCADFVEILLSSHASSDYLRIGEALEIDHLTTRVLVRIYDDDDYEELWIPVEQIFPTVDEP